MWEKSQSIALTIIELNKLCINPLSLYSGAAKMPQSNLHKILKVNEGESIFLEVKPFVPNLYCFG